MSFSISAIDRMSASKHNGMAENKAFTSNFGKSGAKMRDMPWTTSHGTFSEHFSNKYFGFTNDSARTGELIQNSGKLHSPNPLKLCPSGPLEGRDSLGPPTNAASVMGSILAIPEKNVYDNRGPGKGSGTMVDQCKDQAIQLQSQLQQLPSKSSTSARDYNSTSNERSTAQIQGLDQNSREPITSGFSQSPTSPTSPSPDKTSPRRRQYRYQPSQNPLTNQLPGSYGEDLSQQISRITDKSSLWRSNKAVRVNQAMVDSDRAAKMPPKKYNRLDPPRPKQMAEKERAQTIAFGPTPSMRAYGGTGQSPRLRSEVCPRMARDPAPNIIPAGVTAKVGHATTLPGQKRVSVPRQTQVDYAKPRIPAYNKSAHLTEALGGEVADPEWRLEGEYPVFPEIKTDSHEGLWKPWSVCHSGPEWIHEQTIDKKAVLRKIEREKRTKEPVYYPGFTGEVNPWTVSKDSPDFIRGHMEQYEPKSVFGRQKIEKPSEYVDTIVTDSSGVAHVFGRERTVYGLGDEVPGGGGGGGNEQVN